MPRDHIKRETDFQIITNWIADGQRVLDIGCGRGILLEHLRLTKGVYGVGVDISLEKVQACLGRSVNAYQGDAERFLSSQPDQHYDWVVLSRTVQELRHPGQVIENALRVGRHVAVGFVNHGYWVNRWNTLWTGSRGTSEVFPLTWEGGVPYNPVTINGFEAFCRRHGIRIVRRVHLQGDWKREQRWGPNLLAGYAIYDVSKEDR